MIYINNIPSFRDPESFKMTFDNRIEKIEIINDVAIQDYGHVEAGDFFSVTCLFLEENFMRVLDLWNSNTKVTFTDTSGTVWVNLRIVMKEVERDKNFPEYVMATFELWRK